MERLGDGAWTPAEIAEVRRLWGDGAQAPDIAVALGKRVAQVHGKVKALGLDKRRSRRLGGAAAVAESRQRQEDGAGLATTRLGRPPARGDGRRNDGIRRMAAVVWRPSSCQYLRGDARARDFCGAKIKPGSSSYCPDHHALCYRPAPTPTDGAAGEGADG